MSYPVSLFQILSNIVQSFPMLSYPLESCPLFSYTVPSFPLLSYTVLSFPLLSFLVPLLLLHMQGEEYHGLTALHLAIAYGNDEVAEVEI